MPVKLSTVTRDMPIIELHLEGKEAKEIADELGLPSSWQVYNALKRRRRFAKFYQRR